MVSPITITLYYMVIKDLYSTTFEVWKCLI